MTTKGYHFLSIMLILVISFSFSCFTQAQEQGKDFWGGPTTPFTKSSVESINKWGSPLQRKLSQIVTHAIYNSIWDPKEWNAFGAKHDFGAFLKNSANDKSYPQSAQILEPDDPTTYPPQTSDNFFISPNRPFKKFIDILHTKECFVTGGVSCDLVDIRDGWWLRFFPDMFLQPGKLNLRTEGGKRYLIHYALAQVAAGCDAIWYYKQLSPNIVKNSLFNLEDWARLIKETKDYTYKAYGREALVGGTGLYNEYVDYQTDNMFEYFYSPYNRPYEGDSVFLKKDGSAYREFLSSKGGLSEVYHLNCSQSKLPYLHRATFGREDLFGLDSDTGSWTQKDLKSIGLDYSGPQGDGTTYGVPILAVIDSSILSDFTTNVPKEEQINFFCGMVPEMMAVGWRFCFPLNIYLQEKEEEIEQRETPISPVIIEETPKINIYDKLKRLVDFYNYYSNLYQQQIVQWNEDPKEHSIEKFSIAPLITTKVKNLSYVVNKYRDRAYLVSIHLINHLYEDYEIREQLDFSIEIPVKFKPLSVTMVSPDTEEFTKSTQLAFSYKEGSVVMRIPKIIYYNVILIEGRPFTPIEEKEAFSSTSLKGKEE